MWGTQGKLAAELGCSREWLNRVINGKGELGILYTLRLAILMDEDALAALREFGYTEEADLLAKIFTPPKLTRAQIDVAERFGKLSSKRQHGFKTLLDAE